MAHTSSQDDRWLISPRSRTCIVENLREAELFLSGIEIGSGDDQQIE